MKKQLLLCTLCLAILAGCGNSEEIERLQRINSELSRQNSELNSKNSEQQLIVAELQLTQDRLDFLASRSAGVKALMVTSMGDIELEFFPDKAPIHVFNFITRAESGFYDQTQFHRLIPGFMIQGGDPNSKDGDPYTNGAGGPIIPIPHEFNDTDHRRGILSMARTGDKTAGAGSQFFIMHANRGHLNNEYTAFGRVTNGMDVVDAIVDVPKSSDPRLRDHPAEPVVIERIEVFRE